MIPLTNINNVKITKAQNINLKLQQKLDNIAEWYMNVGYQRQKSKQEAQLLQRKLHKCSVSSG